MLYGGRVRWMVERSVRLRRVVLAGDLVQQRIRRVCRIARGRLVVEVQLGVRVEVGELVEVEVGAERRQELVEIARVGQVGEREPEVPVRLAPLGGVRGPRGALRALPRDVLLLVPLELLEWRWTSKLVACIVFCFKQRLKGQ